ncbi:MAG: nickel pincer cofactor biosynthesis protein LarC [Lachnospiraceae bacterium]|nr:nickel pincer cofactor biosynthesis protein LarC [Lachnospiraceae bacterium]
MLYLECYSGISGDMTVAALLDLGADREKLLEGLASLGLSGYEVKIGRRVKCGVEACSFDVELAGDEDGGSHDYVEYEHRQGNGHEHQHGHGESRGHLHAHEHEDGHEHTHGHLHAHEHEDGHEHTHGHLHAHEHEDGHEHTNGQGYSHEHGHSHMHGYGDGHGHEHGHVHRNLGDITEIIRRSGMTERAKETALRIFGIVAEAEAKVHGKDISEVHFHEVGAVDSIVDIAAAAICLDDLDITEAVVSEICEGSGHVHCQHGILPVPVPAVMAVAEARGLFLRMTDTRGEMVTPTGAAIAAGVRTRERLPESFRILKTGIGAGKKDFPKANILRACLIEERPESGSGRRPGDGPGAGDGREAGVCPGAEDGLWMLETNIDDATGEALGYVMERLFAAGARDVCYLPAFMKKNRPAWLMKVVCDEGKREALEDIIFRHTTTIGIRRYPILRTVLPRKIRTVETSYGPAGVKEVRRGELAFCYPEYEDVARYADSSGKPFQDIYEEIRRQAEAF